MFCIQNIAKYLNKVNQMLDVTAFKPIWNAIPDELRKVYDSNLAFNRVETGHLMPKLAKINRTLIDNKLSGKINWAVTSAFKHFVEYKNLMSQLEQGHSIFDELPKMNLKLFSKKDAPDILKNLKAIHGELHTVDNLQFRDFLRLEDVGNDNDLRLLISDFMSDFHTSLTQADNGKRIYNLDEFAVAKLLVNGKQEGQNAFFNKFNEVFGATYAMTVATEVNKRVPYFDFKNVGQNFDTSLRSLLGEEFSASHLEAFRKALMAESLAPRNKFWAFTQTMQGLTRIGKYVIPQSIQIPLTLTSTAGAVVNVNAGTMGIRKIMGSEVVQDFFLNKNKILDLTIEESEIAKNKYENSENWIQKWMQAIVGKLPVVGGALTKLSTTGWHNSVDIMFDVAFKQKSMAQAIQKVMGISDVNINILESAIRRWDVSPETVQRIGFEADKLYNQIRGGGGTAVFSQNKFSRNHFYLATNFLQTFTMVRLGQVQEALYEFLRGFETGKFKTINDIQYHVLYENQDLKALLMSAYYASEYAARATKTLNQIDSQADDDNALFEQTVPGFNEYVQAIETSVWTQMIKGFLENSVGNNYNYTEKTGEKLSMTDKLFATVNATLSPYMRSYFKELKPLGYGWLLTGDPSDLGMKLDIMNKKVFDGFGRIGYNPVDMPFDYSLPPEQDDWLGWALLTKTHTNEALSEFMKYRSVTDVENLIAGDAVDFMSNLATKVNVLGPLWQSMRNNGDPNKIAVGTELDWKKLEKVRDNDIIMKSIYAWDNSAVAEVLAEYKRANLFTPEKYDSILTGYLNELYDFNYIHSSKKYWKDGKFLFADSDFSKEKEQLFTEALAKDLKIDVRELGTALEQAGNSGKFDTERTGFTTDEEKGLAKLHMMVTTKSVGHGKAVLGFLSGREIDQRTVQRKTELFGDKYVDSRDLPVEEMQKIQQDVLTKYYPLLYEVDKTSYIKLARDRLQQVFPNVKVSENMKTTINSLTLQDTVAHQLAYEGNVNAAEVKSVTNQIGKYVKGEAERMFMINQFQETVDNMKTDDETKRLLKMGNLLGNMDFIGRIAKDGAIAEKHPELWNDTMSYVFGTQELLNDQALEGVNDAILQKKAGYGNSYAYQKGYQYQKNPYTQYNKQAYDDYNNAIPGIREAVNGRYRDNTGDYNPMTSRSSRNMSRGYSFNDRFLTPRPQFHDIVVRAWIQGGAAQTEQLVKQNVRRYPAEVLSNLRYSKDYTARKIKPVMFYKPKYKKPYPSRTGPNFNLPGGLAQKL